MKKPSTCEGCPLFLLGEGFVPPSGRMEKGVAIVGEAPGELEISEGENFVGPAGKVLNRIIERTKDPRDPSNLFLRSDFPTANCLWCRPPDNKLWDSKEFNAEEAIAYCTRRHLFPYLEKIKPSCILGLGGTSLFALTGYKGVDSLRGYVFPTSYGPGVFSYHPSHIMRGNFHLSRVVQMDLLRAVDVAKGVSLTRDKSYVVDPSPIEFEAWAEEALKDPSRVISFDIETLHPNWGKGKDKDDVIGAELSTEEGDQSYSILRISFSYEDFSAVSVPWSTMYLLPIAKLLASKNPKIGWNCLSFDIPRLEANGYEVNGLILDGMLIFHFLEPALPMGLKFVATVYCPDIHAWKRDPQENFGWYNCADSDIARRCTMLSINQLKSQGRWDTYARLFVQVADFLRKVSLKGISVDKKARAQSRKGFEERFDALVGELQDEVPLECFPIKIYKKTKEQLKKVNKKGESTWKEGERWIPVKVEISQEEYEKELARSAKKEQQKKSKATPTKRARRGSYLSNSAESATIST